MGVTVQIVRNHRRPKGCPVTNEDRRTLELRVTYNRVPRYYVTNGTVRLTEEEYRNANLKIHKEAFEEVRADYKAALDIVRKLGEHFSFDSFACDYKRLVRKEIANVYDVRSIFSEYISDTSRSRPISDKTKITYDTTLNWLIKFKKYMTINEITPESVSNFVSFLRKSNPDISRNTINIYLRSLRAVYNFAVDRGYIDDRKPFRKLSLTSSRKMNYGLSSKSLQQIFEYDTKDDLAQFGRDMFILSFEMNGHYLSDILRFKNKNIKETEDGWIMEFKRHKTKEHAIPVSLFITDTAKQIMSKYGCIDLSRPNEYIFPFLVNANTERQISNRIHDINDRANQGLRIIAEKLELPHITMAQARHTYATLQYESGRPLLDLQMDMGHTNSTTTQGYINSLRINSMKKSKMIKELLHEGVSMTS